MLRAQLGLAPKAIADWWTQLQTADPAQREAMVEAVGKTRSRAGGGAVTNAASGTGAADAAVADDAAVGAAEADGAATPRRSRRRRRRRFRGPAA